MAMGCIHFAVHLPDTPFPGEEIDKTVYGCVGAHNGSNTAEHGIGVFKTSYLDRSHSIEEIKMTRQIKQVLDPSGLLNPGNILPGDRHRD